MLRAGRIVGWLLAAAAACFAAALLAVNLYVQSQGTHTRIQQELSQRLGMPLHVQRISVTPWAGLRLSGITIPQSNPADAPAFLQANSLRLRVRVRSIFQGPLVIKEVALVKPEVIWAQNESGKWRVPSRTVPGSSSTMTNENPALLHPSDANVLSATAKKPFEHELGMPEPEVKRLKLINGSFHFLDRQNRSVALFNGVGFSSAMRNGKSFRGETSIARVVLRDRVFLSALRARLYYDAATIALSDLQAQVAKGELQGDFSMEPQTPDSPFNAHANFRRVQADELVAEAGGSKETVRGVLEGTLEASGKLGDPAALTGTGTIALQGGHVQQFALLAAVGQVLQIEELTQLDLEEAQATYGLAGNSVLIDGLVLRSPNLRLNATGTIDFNGKVALDSKLTINDKIRSQLFRGMRENFVATDQSGEYSLPFHIGGTLEKPKTDLMERAVGVDLKNIGGVIDALFGRGKSRRKKDEQALPSPPPPSATPVLSPAAIPTP
jgi:type II secretion system protein N